MSAETVSLSARGEALPWAAGHGPESTHDTHTTHNRAAPSDCRSSVSMEPLDGQTGSTTWKLTRGPGGMVLKTPAKGKLAKQHRVPFAVERRIEWAASLLGVASADIDGRLLNALCDSEGSGAYHSTHGELSSSCPPARAAYTRTMLIRADPQPQVRPLQQSQL